MEKYLITGYSGFVGKYFLAYLDSLGKSLEVIGISRSQIELLHYNNIKFKSYQVDLKNAQAVKEIISSTRPNYIIHLASESSVAYSWQNPLESFQNNTNVFLNIVESVRLIALKCRILSIGSSEEYGIVNPQTLPLTETHELNPISPYAVARVSQEMLSKIYSEGYGLDIVITRSFNHIGAGQKENFVVSSFVKQVVERKIKGLNNPIEVGDLSIVRDFLDVKDVVDAYVQLLKFGISGQVYNVCSGIGFSLNEILNKIKTITKTEIVFKINMNRIRPSDNPIIIGNNIKLKKVCNWSPKFSIDESLNSIVDYWECELKKNL